MRISAIIDGQPVTVVDITRIGSAAYVSYVTSTGSLVSKQVFTSAATDPYIILSTSAVPVS